MCKKAQRGVGIRGCWASWPSPTLSPSVPGNQAPGVRRTQRWHKQHPSCHFGFGMLGGWCSEGVQGLMRNRLWGCGPVDQHFCGRAWQASILTLPTPTPPLLWVGWGSVLPRVLYSAAPCGGWQALP